MGIAVMERGRAGKAVDERKLSDCGYGCGTRVVWAPLAGTGQRRTFNPEWCALGADVWVLRRGKGMVSCSQLHDGALAVLREQGVRGWRLHTCDEYQPGMRHFDLPGRLEVGG